MALALATPDLAAGPSSFMKLTAMPLSADPLLPDTRRLGEALRKLGVEAEEKYYPGELHAFHALVMRSNARKCWTDTFGFLKRHV